MALIAIPNTFTDGTLITAAATNANYNEVQTKFNASAVLTDVAKTITVQHTMSAGLIISAGTLAAQAITGTTAGFTAITGSSLVLSGAADVGPNSIVRSGTGITTSLQLLQNATAQWYIENRATTGLFALKAGTLDVLTLNTSGAATFASSIALLPANSQIIPGTLSLSLRNNANTADNLIVSDAGMATVRAGLTVSAGGAAVTGNSTVTGTLTSTQALAVQAGGAAITGNSTVTGNLAVTGTLSGALGLVTSTQVAATASNTTTGPQTVLSVALGANQVWRVDFDLIVSCNGIGGVVFSFTAPATATAQVMGTGPTSSATATTNVAGASTALQPAFSTFNSATAPVYVRYSTTVTTGGTAGNFNIAFNPVTAGQTATVNAGSSLLATRIS